MQPSQKLPNDAELEALFDSGLSNVEIADRYGVSRERVRQRRNKLGKSPSPHSRLAVRQAQQKEAEWRKAPSGFKCRVCGEDIPNSRYAGFPNGPRTCKPQCGAKYRARRWRYQ